MHAGRTQNIEMRSVGVERVLDDDHRQVGMVAAKALEATARGVTFAIVLGVAVVVNDRFGCQRDHFLAIGMDQRRPRDLMRPGRALPRCRQRNTS